MSIAVISNSRYHFKEWCIDNRMLYKDGNFHNKEWERLICITEKCQLRGHRFTKVIDITPIFCNTQRIREALQEAKLRVK